MPAEGEDALGTTGKDAGATQRRSFASPAARVR